MLWSSMYMIMSSNIQISKEISLIIKITTTIIIFTSILTVIIIIYHHRHHHQILPQMKHIEQGSDYTKRKQVNVVDENKQQVSDLQNTNLRERRR